MTYVRCEDETADSSSAAIDKVMGNSYQLVREVYKNLPYIRLLTERLVEFESKDVDFRNNTAIDKIEWKYTNETEWREFLAYADFISLVPTQVGLTGDAGTNGTDGTFDLAFSGGITPL